MMNSNNNILKYQNPVLIRNKSVEENFNENTKHRQKYQSDGAECSKNKGESDILDTIFPPRDWSQDGKLWRKKISSTPATRSDLISLHENVNYRMKQAQAKEIGICPIRREIYSQLFDELIRQVTVNCAERGLLLVKVRDELLMTLVAYKTLFESSMAFKFRKTLSMHKDVERITKQLEDTLKENKELKENLQECQLLLKETKQQNEIEKQKQKEVNQEEVEKLKTINDQLKVQLMLLIEEKN